MKRASRKKLGVTLQPSSGHNVSGAAPTGRDIACRGGDAQAKAIVFAGVDLTAVMLATILFHLVQNVDV